MNKKIVIFIIICVALTVSAIFYFKSGKDTEAVNASTQNFNNATVTRGDIKQSITESSVIESNKRQEIRFGSDGTVEKVYVEIGQQVEEGDIILTLESDSENTSLEITKKNLELEQKELDELKEDLNNLKIYASVDGVVTVDVNEGEKVSDNGAIGTITDKSKMEIVAPINNKVIKNISMGDKASIFFPDNFSTVAGYVTKIGQSSKASEEGYVYYDVTVEFVNPGGLYEEMLGQVKITNAYGTYSSIENVAIANKESEDIRVDTGGKIEKIYVSDNDVVKKGDLIAVIDDSEIRSQIDKQKIAVEQSQLNLEDKYESLDDVVIKAPISGTIVTLEVADGDNVEQNDTVCVIADVEDLKVVVPVDELDVFKIKEGQQAIITTDVFSDKEYSGKVERVALEGQESNGVSTFDVTIGLEETQNLRIGMTVNAEIVIEESTDALLIPVEAAKKFNGKYMVMTSIPADENKNGLTEVEIGIMNDTYVEITSGLSEGDTVYYSSTISTNSNEERRGMGIGMPGMGGPGGGRSRN